MGAKSGRKATKAQESAAKSAGFKRFALVVFGGLFIALFVIFAVAQGIGQPSVPSGDVALVKNVPNGNISEAEYKVALAQQVSGSGGKAPKPGSKKAEELKEAALSELIEGRWVRGEAEELGITVTDKQVETELAQIKKSSFPTEKKFQEFLKTSGYSRADVNRLVEVRVMGTQIQEKVLAKAPPVSAALIASYYETEKESQFTTKPSRDVRLIVNRNKAKVEEAKEALDKDDSDANWKVVAKKYSVDPTTKAKGGLQKEITEEFLQGVLKKAIFGSATGEVVGPVGFQGNYFVVEVEKLNPKKVKDLAEVKSQISTQLAEQVQQEYFQEWVTGFRTKWTSRTFCGSDFLVANCSNNKGNGHPSTAPESCYEANPKTPPTECPAPVEQTKPAVPGTVTLLKPTGEPLVQRPQPVPTKAATKEAAQKAIEEKIQGASSGE